MKRTSILAFAAGVTSTAALALLIATGPEHDDHKNLIEQLDTLESELDQMDMMAEMAKLSTPGANHQALGIMVGEWSVKTSFSMGPDAPAAEGTGVMTVQWVLGKRYIQSSFKSDFMGQPFEGIGYTGYDIAHEQYIGSWMDTMSTKITIMTGNEEAGDALVMYGTSTTPMGDNPMKIITKFTDANSWTDTFFDKLPGSEEWTQSGTIIYTRIED